MKDNRTIFISIVLVSISFLFATSILAQRNDVIPVDSANLGFETEDQNTFKKRRKIAAIGVGAGYIFGSVGLYNSWYRNFDQSGFHFFNDWDEWQNMDKTGHVFSSYFQASLGYKIARWTGMKEKQAIESSLISGMLFQTTIELMDAFSTKWGFSITDMGANILGSSAFALQQKYWGEQKIIIKVSSIPSQYSESIIYSQTGNTITSIQERADDLFGSSYLERFLKDYNAQSYWLSFNISALTKHEIFPKWLNLAVGYSGQNMFGGFENVWSINGEDFDLENTHQRYQQFILGLDVDFARIKTKSKLLKTLFDALNLYKIPMPGIELSSAGDLSFHLLFTN